MSVSLYDLSVGSYVQILEGVVATLDKGAAHCEANGIALDEVVETRLRDDMANFHFQVVCVSHHSIGTIEALRSGEFRPPNYEPCDYASLQKMTGESLAALKGLSKDEVEGFSGGKVVFKMGGNEIPFTAENFVLSFSLPNFYFHAATAYDVLRMKGAPIGKLDFLGPIKAGA